MKVPFLSLHDVTAKYKDEIHEAALRVIDSGWYLQGDANASFETHYADYIGTKHCIGCANGLDALWLIFRAYRELGLLHAGDEVIVPANTFIATIIAITDNELTPILVEPNPDTLQIDDQLIEERLTPKTKAICIVHLYGRNAYTNRIGEICKRNHLKLIEDNAQAHGCKAHIMASDSPNTRRFYVRTGAIGDAAGHSFYPGKNLGALGDGGAVTTNDDILASTIRILANYGCQRKYVFQYAGRNSRLDEIQAAILDVKLKHLDEDIRLRQEVADYYYENIYNPIISLPKRISHEQNVYHLFPILVSSSQEKLEDKYRNQLLKYLEENGVGTVIHYPIPPHLQSCYSHSSWNNYSYHDSNKEGRSTRLPITERLANEELSLPMSPCMTKLQVEYVVELLNRFITC